MPYKRLHSYLLYPFAYFGKQYLFKGKNGNRATRQHRVRGRASSLSLFARHYYFTLISGHKVVPRPKKKSSKTLPSKRTMCYCLK